MNRWTVAKTGTEIVFSHRKVRLLWQESAQGLAFSGICRVERSSRGGKTGRGFTFGPGSPLWKVELRDRAGYPIFLTGQAAKGFSYKAGTSLALRWRGLAEGKVDVVITVDADDEPVTRWRLEVVNRSPDHTVWAVTFPSFTDVRGPSGSHRDDYLITTDGFGSMIPDPIRQPRLTAWTNRGYPNGVQSLSLVALVNAGLGLYLGTHDPAAGLQRFNHLPDRQHDRLPMEVLVEPIDAGRRQRRVKLNYDTVLALFEGDWWEVAQLHRPWAIRQKWARRTIARRDDIPEWARQIALWVRVDIGNLPEVSPREMLRRADIAVAFRKALGRDIAAHLYQWHDHPFDIDYPSYRPRKGIAAFVRRMQSNGVHVMPYINGRLFDPDNRHWERQKAYRYATKGANPKLGSHAARLFTEVYGSMTPMAVMCAGTRYWQDKIAGTVERLVRDLDVDGVYIDQVAAAWSEVCSDPSHGHPLRGGGWWIEGYQRMLDRTRQRLAALGKKVLLTTECNADPYMGMFGGMLMVHGVRNHVVPMFPAIYGGRAPLFARSAHLDQPSAFRIMAGQNVLWGCQPGWFGLPEMEKLVTPAYRKDLEFLKALCDLYDRLRPYTQAGTMLRPPAIEGAKVVPVVWKFCGEWPEKVSTVWAARWALPKGSALAVVNAHPRDQQVTLALPAEERAVAAQKACWSGGVPGRVSFRGGRVRLDMPGLSAAMLWF